MKNKIFITLKLLVIVGIIFGTVSYAFAWSLPLRSGPHEPGKTFGSINVCCTTDTIQTGADIIGPNGEVIGTVPFSFDPDQRAIAQVKIGPIMTEGFFKAGIQYPWTTDGSIVAESKVMSDKGYFKKVFYPGTTSKLIVGSTLSLGGIPANTPSLAIAAVRPPLGISATGRATGLPARDVISMKADVNFCNTQTSISNTTPAIQFWNRNTNTEADVIARGIQLKGGSPEPGMVLVSTDADGNAVWGTPKLEANGTISYVYGVAPVVDGQAICN